MNSDPDTAALDSELDGFVREIALSVSVHRDRSPAMVWPEHEPVALLTGLADVAAARLELLSGRWWNVLSAGPEATVLADRLQAALGRLVRADYAAAPSWQDSSELNVDGEALLLPLRGGYDFTVFPPAAAGRLGESPAGSTTPLRLRLHTAEVLYAPTGWRLSVSGGTTAAVLLVLHLTAPGA
ncbi:hypothetical protein K1Y78_14130 [Streptomyces sp. tea 10]|nr:hypothetical protein [Streptomyces sp. tea 10]